MAEKQKITNEQRKKYNEIDWFWGTQVPCQYCGICSCGACHPNGPCIPKPCKVCGNCLGAVSHPKGPCVPNKKSVRRKK